MSELAVSQRNFAFLHQRDPLLAQLGAAAERYCIADPMACLLKLREFGEVVARLCRLSAVLAISIIDGRAGEFEEVVKAHRQGNRRQTQFSKRKPATRSNSRRLLVTRV